MAAGTRRLAPEGGGRVVFDGDAKASYGPAFDADAGRSAKIARAVTETLLVAGLPCADNRPCASKPGTLGCAPTSKSSKDDVCTTWMAGYTPQVSAAVWVGSENLSALKDKESKPLTGKTVAGAVWQGFMAAYLAGTPVEQFPPLA